MNPRAKDLTAAQVADELNCSPKTVRKLAKKGDLRGYRLGSDWRFQRTDVDAFRRRRSHDGEPIVQQPRAKARVGGHLPGWHDYDHGGRPS